ncbi:aspartate dehydrogenase [Bariatricus sp. SGI.154]|uniref:aspartate dehydrogenase n=1 Tax=Bariatricus sp. SGI.154 TaxID=3420549 RepID=UPI003D08E463
MLHPFKKKETIRKEYDKENQKPVIRCSICTGEQVAGFKDIHTGKFQDIMLIRNAKDLEEFKRMYGVDELEKEY